MGISRCNMSLANCSSMEDIPLEDEERTSIEYRVLMAYAQRRLPASKYGEILEREAKGQEGLSLARKEAQGVTPAEQGKAPQDKPPEDLKTRATRKSQKKRRRSNWKRLLVPACLRGQTEEDSGKSEVNGKLDLHAGIRIKPGSSTEPQEDWDIARVADKLAGLVDHSTSRSKGIENRGLVRTRSIEEDGPGASKTVLQGPYEDDGEEGKEKLIGTIVALLRKSGDDLEEKMQGDKSFSSSVWDLMSYSFFGRILNQFLGEVPMDRTGDSEADVQCEKVAYVMEVTTRLTAVDTRPTNRMLGFGTKYLTENFRPWVCSQGGWEKALGLDQEEVE